MYKIMKLNGEDYSYAQALKWYFWALDEYYNDDDPHTASYFMDCARALKNTAWCDEYLEMKQEIAIAKLKSGSRTSKWYNTSTESSNLTPYTGMRVGTNQTSTWEWQGTDNTTCGEPTIKYSYKDDDTRYTIWVSNETSKVVKVSTTYYGEKAKSKNSSNNSNSDSYDVDDYDSPEDFYYWNKDDFTDYEDAEDYYNSHR